MNKVAHKSRLLFIDLLRGWAILIMIEVHVFNSLIIPSIKDQGWFTYLNFINGLVAPSFLFISGFAFIISSQKGVDELRQFGYAFWKKLSRILLILIVGYSLHVPFFSLKRVIADSTPDQLLGFYNVDILQNIAIGLLFIFLSRILIKSEKVFNYFIITIAILIIFSAPFIWSIDFKQYFHVALADYFNPSYGSYFPLFPWIGFLLCGAIACIYYLKARENNEEKVYIKTITVIGLVMMAIGHFYLSDIFPESYRSAKPHPVFFFQRLGYVLVLFSICWYYLKRVADKNPENPNKISFFNSYVISTGRESLLIYWLHLQILYRRLWNGKSLESVVGQSFNVFQCVTTTLLLIIMMVIAAKSWGTFKSKNKKAASYVTAAVLIVVSLIFLLDIKVI